jgi:hypothetical protein
MKHLLQTILPALVSIVLITNPSVAQNGSGNVKPNIAINVSAKIIPSIEMITIQSMRLSQAEAVNNVIRINPQTHAYAGKMIAIGTPNTDIRVSFLQQRELTQRQGSSTLLFNYQVAGNNVDDQSTAEMLGQDNRDFEFNSEGRFYLWIGGSVDISTATPGNYQGEFTLEIEYI